MAAFEKADRLKHDDPVIRKNVRLTQRWIAFDKEFADLLAGKTTLRDARELFDLARFCAEYKGCHRAAAWFYAEAFDADDSLTRYPAARSAALAAAGKAEDAANLDDGERFRLRRQALRWLRAGLTALSAYVKQATGKADYARAALTAWKTEPDLATIRDKGALDKLPEADRAPFVKFWAEVDALLTKLARGK